MCGAIHKLSTVSTSKSHFIFKPYNNYLYLYTIRRWVAKVVATKTMLSTINAAVEPYLGMNICFATLALDEPDRNLSSVAQEALQSLGLLQVLGTIRAAKPEILAYRQDVYKGTNRQS